jgi:YD repeat-containing protein
MILVALVENLCPVISNSAPIMSSWPYLRSRHVVGTMDRFIWIFALVVGLMGALAAKADAQTSYAYTYDPLGRLTQVSRTLSSTTNTICYTYDKTDNRKGVSAGCNGLPEAVPDYLYYESPTHSWSGYLGALSNDTDPDFPSETLTITGLSGTTAAYVVGGGTDIWFSGSDGYHVFNYTIQDTRGGVSQGEIQLYIVFVSPCGEFEC